MEFFSLATEAHDDYGCPHTLEHLIFLGSEDYPYKGVLDAFANRSLASGTNAWTDIDSTAYTLTTAGSEGFLNMLPVYLDHILYPTLTEEGFMTEVHHITGAGEDCGVVYCEMAGRENSADSKIYYELGQLLFPGKCGYKSETGGKLKELRELDVQTVRQYHADYYRPENLCIIIQGEINEKEVFEALAPVEKKIMLKKEKNDQKSDYSRPWNKDDIINEFLESVTKTVEFPSAEEDVASVCIAWRGPSRFDSDCEDHYAVELLWEYLADSTVSPLQKIFVDIDDPYCGDVDPSLEWNGITTQVCEFSNVPIEKLDQIKDLFFETLNDIFEKKDIDLQRISSLIQRNIQKYTSSLEDTTFDFVPAIIYEFNYGEKTSDLKNILNRLEKWKYYETRDTEYWLQVLKKWCIDQPHVCILGKPSDQMAELDSKNEKERVDRQVKELGEEKLKELQQKLDKANEINSIEAPTDVLTTIKIPDVSKISLIPVCTFRNDIDIIPSEESNRIKKQYLDINPKKIPFWIQFDHVPSAFVEYNITLDTSQFNVEHRLWIELYLEVVFESYIERKGELVSHKTVVQELNEFFVEFSNTTGITSSGNFYCGIFSNLVMLSFKSTNNKYQESVDWIHQILYKTKFKADRLKSGCKKLLGDVSRQKRSGSKVCDSFVSKMNFEKNSNHNVCNFMTQQEFLTKISERLQNEPEVVEKEFENFLEKLLDPSLLRVEIIGDLTSYDKSPKDVWFNLLPENFTEEAYFGKDVNWISQSRIENCSSRFLCGVKGLDAGYSQLTYLGPILGHDDIPKILLLNKYLCVMEGLFWKKLRGLGLTYGANLDYSAEEGLINFSLFKSTAIPEAVLAAKKIIDEEIDFEETFLDSVKSSLIFDIISSERNMNSAAFNQFVLYLQKKKNPKANKELIENINKLNIQDLKETNEKYLKPLFSEKSNFIGTVPPAKMQETIDQFKQNGIICESVEMEFLATK